MWESSTKTPTLVEWIFFNTNGQKVDFFLFETLCKFLWLMFRNPLTLPMIFLIEVILLTKAVFIAQRVVFLYLD